MDLLNIKELDRWIVGDSWINSEIHDHLNKLCDEIGPRWATSKEERYAGNYLHEKFQEYGLDVERDNFEIESWIPRNFTLKINESSLDIKPFNRCPSINIKSKIIDVGFGTEREINFHSKNLTGKIALMDHGFEPFSKPIHYSLRIKMLVSKGIKAIIIIDKKIGRRMEYHSVSDFRDSNPQKHSVPVVTTSREHSVLLKKAANNESLVSLSVESEIYNASTSNIIGKIKGKNNQGEHLILCGHHDTVYGSPGGNDNASGTIGVIETARVLSKMFNFFDIKPNLSIYFLTLSAEEQGLQGSHHFAKTKYNKNQIKPRLVINLDELSTGPLKGLVLGFPHLRDFLQNKIDELNENLKVHVMSQLDPTSDHYPFLAQGIDASHLWRWRFDKRHASSEFHHESADTSDKVNIPELKNYIANLSRILFRLSITETESWPSNNISIEKLRERIKQEKDSVIRVF
ncbi:MAG: hypothetical protein CL764_01200 [Chloroflexi bacterium]|nr:hypothetical protein [Chloroflexota bacterium]